MSSPTKKKRPGGWGKKLLALAVLAVVVLGALWLFRSDESGYESSGTTYTVTRGPMEIAVSEGGTIEAKESQEVRSEVHGQTKILKVVDEGYFVSPEDVKNGLVLVELDSEELVERQTQQELEYQNAYASYAEAREQYDIQISGNESDIKAATLEVKFAKMDLEKYLSAEVANSIVEELGIEATAEAELAKIRASQAARQAEEDEASRLPVPTPEKGETEAKAEGAEQKEAVAEEAPAQEGATEVTVDPKGMSVAVESVHRPTQMAGFDFTKYADPERLGDGEAGQKLRKLEDDLLLAQSKQVLAQEDFDGTSRLLDRGFVTENEYKRDKLALESTQVSLETARTSRELFIKYDFPKQAEKLLSDYEEALRKLQRAERTASAKLAQAKARLNSANARYTLQIKRREEIAEQLEKCVIKAERSGLVVYGGEERWYREERIEVGAEVHERQIIITIPDTALMTAQVKVHESMVKQVKEGQPARIKVDAYDDQVLEGKVGKIGVLPDSQNRWMSPDVKVYKTEILVEGSHGWLKPGMTAEAEIIVGQLEDVLRVPLQAVSPSKGEQVCYVVNGGAPERRVVETGQHNESFIEIISGLEEGDTVLLRVPDSLREHPGTEEQGAETVAQDEAALAQRQEG